MRQGPVLRNSLIVALPSVVVACLAFLVTLVLPGMRGIHSASAAEVPAAAARDSDATNLAGPSESVDSRLISALVRQLGDPSYSVRQQATKRLIELGIATRELLTEALSDDDAEIRSRAWHVLSQVNDADFRARLAAFENDLDGRQHNTLPGWDRFSRAFGQEKVARTLFVEMQRSERDLLEALESDPKLARDRLAMRLKAILESLQLTLRDASGGPAIEMGTIYALLMVSADEDVALLDGEAKQVLDLVQLPQFQTNLNASPKSTILRKMLGTWIVHNNSVNLAPHCLLLAFNHDLKEGLDLGKKLLANEGSGQPPVVRQYALLAIGRFGNHEHIALVEPLLKDSSPCMPQPPNDPRQSQVRDVALAVLVHLSGQELKDYGLDRIQPNSQMLFLPQTIAFDDPLARKAA